jgi:hypothetical protein
MPKLMQGRKYGDDKPSKYSSKMRTSKKDKESRNTCKTDHEFINATHFDNEWSEEWLIDTGQSSGNVTSSLLQDNKCKPMVIIIKVGNGELCDMKCKGECSNNAGMVSDWVGMLWCQQAFPKTSKVENGHKQMAIRLLWRVKTKRISSPRRKGK